MFNHNHIYHLEIVTPNSTVFNGDVISTKLPATVSPFQVLVNHAPIVAALDVGPIAVVDAAEVTHLFATSGGFAEMKDNRLTVTAETAEKAEKIDGPRAGRAAGRAEERITQSRREHDKSIDLIRAEAALARAENRLKIASQLRL